MNSGTVRTSHLSATMPKVLRIINRFNLGGITYNVSYLSRYLSPEYQTLLVGGPEEKDEENSLFIPHSMGLEPIIIPELRRSINPFQDYLAYRRLKGLIREYRPDIVHTHASKAGFIGRLAARHCGVPVIVHTFHGHVFKGYFPGPVNFVLRAIERYLAGISSRIVTISAEQKNQICLEHRICEEHKAVVIPLGFDLSRFVEQQPVKRLAFRQRFLLREEEIAIVIIGRLAPVKNHRLFIDAVLHAAAQCKTIFRAFLVGDGKTRAELEHYLQSKNASYSSRPEDKALFTFTGWIKEADVVLAGADLVCLSSKNEGTPVSLIEAQAAGKYCVSTDVGGIRDILAPASGVLSKAEDEEAYKDLLLDTIRHFEERQGAAAEGREQILQRFSYQRLCSDMSRLYETLLAERTLS